MFEGEHLAYCVISQYLISFVKSQNREGAEDERAGDGLFHILFLPKIKIISPAKRNGTARNRGFSLRAAPTIMLEVCDDRAATCSEVRPEHKKGS